MIEIVQTPPLNTVQDRGRVGHRAFGIGRSGAMDRLALDVGNALVGNASLGQGVDGAGIELQLFPVRIRFHADLLVALTGADCRATIDGEPWMPWWTRPVRAGQELLCRSPRKGLRSYLTVTGGIDVPLVFGSRSTHLRTGFGGLEGRALVAGDRLAVGFGPTTHPVNPAGFGAVDPQARLPSPECGAGPGDIVLRAIPAAEQDDFDAASRVAFWASSWSVTAKSNRQGCQMDGPALRREADLEMRSHPIVPGVVQVPPSGHPMIQLADANTAGGYPKIAVVIEADLWRLSQAAPGACVRFVPCTPDEARAAGRAIAAFVGGIERLSRYLRSGPEPHP